MKKSKKKSKDLIYIYGVREKETGRIVPKYSGGKFYERRPDAIKKVEKMGTDQYEVVTYRLLDLGAEAIPDPSVKQQERVRKVSAGKIDKWIDYQCGTLD